MNYKHHKNIYLSVISYIIAFAWFIGWLQVGYTTHGVSPLPSFLDKIITNQTIIVVFYIFLMIGIYFGAKSNKRKESTWAGNLVMAVGIVIVIAYSLLAAGFGGY